MQTKSNTVEKSGSYSSTSSVANTRLTGSRLIIARAVWLALVVPSLGLFVVSLLVSYQQLQSGGTPAQGQQSLSTIGLSVSGFAALVTIFLRDHRSNLVRGRLPHFLAQV